VIVGNLERDVLEVVLAGSLDAKPRSGDHFSSSNLWMVLEGGRRRHSMAA
jgi:hypothetical protein